MHIDPLTFVAQVVNFLILVAILKRFLYRPLLNAMEQRERSLAERQAEVERKQHEVDEAATRVAAVEKELASHRAAGLADVAREAEERRREYETTARRSVDAESQEWRRALQQDRVKWLDSVRAEVLAGVNQVSRHVLSDLASTDLEVAVVDGFLRRMESLSAEQQAQLSRQRDVAVVHTSAALPMPLQARVEAALRHQCPLLSSVRFVVDLQGLGIEVIWPGYSSPHTHDGCTVAESQRSDSVGPLAYRLGWTADAYLQDITSAAGRLLDGVNHGAR